MTRAEDYDRMARALEQQLQENAPLVHWQVVRSDKHLVECRKFPGTEFQTLHIFARARINGVRLTASSTIDRHFWEGDNSGAAEYITLLITHRMVKYIMEWRQT